MSVLKTVKQGKPRVTYLGRVHQDHGLYDSEDEDALWGALSQMQVAVDKWILDNIFISSFTFLELSNNLGVFMAMITGGAFLHKRNEEQLRDREIKCVSE